ncbi:MAG TPA: ParB/RepB/Spo0J family partition protein [Terriglobales bacterium]|nr:ParB/RepB/Spo0J family partition protein [Terriglobales bacterium]
MQTITPDKKRALGRGLNSLIPAARSTPPAAAPVATGPVAVMPGEAVQDVAIADVLPNPMQTRVDIDPVALQELADSIAVQGVLQPILVRKVGDGKLELVAGQRRLMASQRAGKTTVPAIVRQISDEQAIEITIIENLQREDLNPLEQAAAFEKLSQQCGLTQEQIAQRTGKDRTTIANYIRLLRLPDWVKQGLRQGVLTMGHARALMGLDPSLIEATAREVVKDALSVRQTEKLVYDILHPSPKPEKKERVVDPNVKEAERELERSLGVRARIYDRSGKGKVVLEYKSLEDFDRIVEALSK